MEVMVHRRILAGTPHARLLASLVTGTLVVCSTCLNVVPYPDRLLQTMPVAWPSP